MSPSRTVAILLKEAIQLRRDRLTLAMMVIIPIVQLMLFGYAINTDPKGLPVAVLIEDRSRFSRAVEVAMVNSGYFEIERRVADQRQADGLLDSGEVAFVVTVPVGFKRALLRGERPQILLAADATDPAAASNALAAFDELASRAISRELGGAYRALSGAPPPFDLVIHRRYNPEGVTRYNIVPGLLGVILTMTTILSTALSLTREAERGTMENLLAMPTRASEIMIGKIAPNIGLGFVQVAIILIAARYLFGVPMLGSLWLLLGVLLVFVAANVSLGYLFSTLARNQMQAMQMTFFFFLPSILLSGFMFPFRGMPQWAQWIGEALPLTHFLRIVRGILLKGNDFVHFAQEFWIIVAFTLAVGALTLLRFRRTLD
jgi:ABC-2 type transport system permease protein